MPCSRVFLAASLWLAGLGGLRASAGVVVLDNWTSEDVEFTIHQTDGREWRYTLPHGDLVPVPAASPLVIAFQSGGQPRQQVLSANTVHCFTPHDNRLELAELRAPTVGGNPPPQPKPPAGGPPAAVAPTDPILTIPVMILADDHEPMAQAPWEKRIRARLAEASKIFEHHCRVRFEAVAVGTWTTEPSVFVYEKAVAEFCARVRLKPPARLAIGFTSRYQWVPAEHRVGVACGPLSSHILIRDAVHGLSEPERVEVLVHELGHCLGAVHVPHSTSVMRPSLGDQKSRLRSFRIRFDAPNTLAMYLVAEEMRLHPIVSLAQLSPERKAVLRGVYTAIAQAMPQDTTAQQYLSVLNMGVLILQPLPPPSPPPTRPATPGTHAFLPPAGAS